MPVYILQILIPLYQNKEDGYMQRERDERQKKKREHKAHEADKQRAHEFALAQLQMETSTHNESAAEVHIRG